MDVTIPGSTAIATNGSYPSRVAITACMVAGMCTFLNVYDTQPLLPYLQRIYHTTEIAVSFTVSATILAVALTAPFVGLLAESIGRKKVIVPSLYALTAPTLLAATSQNLHQLIFWRFMQGLFVPGVIVTTNEQSIGMAIDDILLIAEYMPEEEIKDQVVVYPPFRG